jgi:hypothetical protein
VPHHRRLTDHPPLSDAATRRELDDRFHSVSERMDGHWRLEDERWVNHAEKHNDLAQQLSEYKTAANEWRATLADFRGAAVTRPEYLAEHKALDSKMSGGLQGLDARIDALDLRQDALASLIQKLNDRDDTTRAVLNSGRNLIVVAIALVGAVLGLLTYIAKA